MNKVLLKTIKGKKNFDSVFSNKKVFSSKKLIAIVNFKKEEDSFSDRQNKEDKIISYAVLASKKLSKKAVVRNRVKRLLRESIKKVLNESIDNPYIFENIVLSWKEKLPHHPKLIKFTEVMLSLSEVLNKAYQYYITKEKEGLEADSIAINQGL
ncbi:MAG: ribonuclease P protein component [Ignavibacteria bacterium]|jgi:ribonuclease P protein component|nr:ribonuclease P protein component [Ignavibacteria bacterium]